jgi:hypothetical protein
MWSAIQTYWVAARGYRLRPWKSPYLRWRLETFLGEEAHQPGARAFFSLLWRHRAALRKFLRWAAERRRERRRRT